LRVKDKCILIEVEYIIERGKGGECDD
jgi:hypothetical protein